MIPEKKIYNLKDNDFLRIIGEDKFDFLQGLISNDINKLKNNQSIYSSILSAQGKLIYDFFLSLINNEIILETKKKNIADLKSKLLKYKLRSDIDIIESFNKKSYLVNPKYFDEILKLNIITNHSVFFDPRFDDYILKFYCDDEELKKISDFLNLLFIDNNEYLNLRIKNCIPDFEFDADLNRSILLELRFDDLNGIDWDKGCYLGQEVTARTKYRGKIKKKLYGFYSERPLITSNNDRTVLYHENVIGEVKSFNDKYGLAILKVDIAQDCIEKSNSMSFNKIKIYPYEPKWSIKNSH